MGEWENAIVQGDCIAGLERLAQARPESVDLAFADPPYNIGYEYDEYDDRKAYEEYVAWTSRWTQAVARVLKPTGAFWVAIGDEYAAEMKLALQRDCGLTCRSWVVWYYTFGVNCKFKFTRSHAHLLYFVRDPKKFTFNDEAIRVPSARQLVYGDKRANPRGRIPDDTWIMPPPVPRVTTPEGWVLRPQDVPDAFAPTDDTWYIPRVCGTFAERAGWHGCQMPEQLLGRIIRACSNEGDLVLDPFAGSGSTLIVAKKLGRRYLGFEMSQQYADEACKRLKTTRMGEPLEGVADPLRSVPETGKGRRLDEKDYVYKTPKPVGRPRKNAVRDDGAVVEAETPPVPGLLFG